MVQKIAIKKNRSLGKISDEAKRWMNKNYSEFDSFQERDNEALIAAIEELGGETVGEYSAEFKIVTIPDDVEWKIKGDIGGEYIVEKHRTWR